MTKEQKFTLELRLQATSYTLLFIARETNIKVYEMAFQNDIEEIAKEIWWKVTNVSIFNLFFFEKLSPLQVVDRIIKGIKED